MNFFILIYILITKYCYDYYDHVWRCFHRVMCRNPLSEDNEGKNRIMRVLVPYRRYFGGILIILSDLSTIHCQHNHLLFYAYMSRIVVFCRGYFFQLIYNCALKCGPICNDIISKSYQMRRFDLMWPGHRAQDITIIGFVRFIHRTIIC